VESELQELRSCLGWSGSGRSLQRCVVIAGHREQTTTRNRVRVESTSQSQSQSQPVTMFCTAMPKIVVFGQCR
jgi:hypothetical protein